MTGKLDVLSSGICLVKRIHLDATTNGDICKSKTNRNVKKMNPDKLVDVSGTNRFVTLPGWASKWRQGCLGSLGALYARQNVEKMCSRFLTSK